MKRKTTDGSRISLGEVLPVSGKKISGSFVVGQRSANPISIPVTIISGNKTEEDEGPVLSVIAGEHGCEYCGIVAAIRVIRDTKASDIKGTLVVVPVANTVAFDERVLFVNPLDEVNLYGSYPGNAEGSISYVTAHRIFTEIALKSDYVVHLHGADYNEELVPFNYYARTGKKQVDEMSLKMTRCFPSKYYLEAVLEEDVTVGAPRGTSYAANARGTLYGEASARGIPATMAEAGREGKVEEEFVSILCNGVNNIMKLIGMKKGDVFQNTEMKRLHSPMLVTNKRGGVFLPKSNVGEFVGKGDELAEIVDLRGDVIEVIRSPTDGMIVDRINFAAADSFPTPRQPYLFYIAKVD